MPHYFMHLIDGDDTLIDPDGVDISPDRVEAVTLLQARDCMAGDIKSGSLDLRLRIDVQEGSGAVVHSLCFADAIEVLRAA